MHLNSDQIDAFVASIPEFDHDHPYNEVCLANNNMDDDQFCQFLRALNHLKLSGLTYCENELGPKSIEVLTQLAL